MLRESKIMELQEVKAEYPKARRNKSVMVLGLSDQ